MTYTPFVPTPHNYYTIATQGIYLGGEKLVINPVSGTELIRAVCRVFAYLCTTAATAALSLCEPASIQYGLLWPAGKLCCCL
jgi:hypothetical protein